MVIKCNFSKVLQSRKLKSINQMESMRCDFFFVSLFVYLHMNHF